MNTMNQTPTLTPLSVDAKAAAALLGLSPRTVEAMAATGELPSFRVGRRRLFSVDALRKWVADQSQPQED